MELTDDQKTELIEALKTERERFSRNGMDTKDHDLSIDALLTGNRPSTEMGDYEIYDAVCFDLEQLYKDYCN